MKAVKYLLLGLLDVVLRLLDFLLSPLQYLNPIPQAFKQQPVEGTP